MCPGLRAAGCGHIQTATVCVAFSGVGLARSADSFPLEKSSVLSIKLLLTGVCELLDMQDVE